MSDEHTPLPSNKTRGRMRSFSCFSYLPKELRDHIWELAIDNCQAEPQIHFFSASERKKTFAVEIMANRTTQLWVPWECHVSAPTWKTRNGRSSSWASPKNPSAYLLDSGLWFACRESQDAVLRRWRRFHRLRPGDNKNDTSGVAAITLPVEGENPWQRCISLRTGVDIAVIQLPHLGSTDKLLLKEAICQGPWLRAPYYIGIEFDPMWFSHLAAFEAREVHRSDDRCVFCHLLREIFNFRYNPARGDIFFIDHSTTVRSLKDDDDTPLSAGCAVFNGRGRRYAEVLTFDLDFTWKLAEGSEFFNSALGFCFKLRGHFDNYQHAMSDYRDRVDLWFRVLIPIDEN